MVVFHRCAQNSVSVSDGSRTVSGSEFQRVGRETAKLCPSPQNGGDWRVSRLACGWLRRKKYKRKRWTS